jgi:hypothetical protein
MARCEAFGHPTSYAIPPYVARDRRDDSTMDRKDFGRGVTTASFSLHRQP